MNVEKMGTYAGYVWGELNNNGRMSLAELKLNIGLTDAELYSAIGWLARENKIAIDGEDVELV